MRVDVVLVVVIVCNFGKLVGGYTNDTKVTTYRGGKFLFDALFGLGEDLDLTDGDNKLTKCDCGEYMIENRNMIMFLNFLSIILQ
jgi:hypothetical protein